MDKFKVKEVDGRMVFEKPSGEYMECFYCDETARSVLIIKEAVENVRDQINVPVCDEHVKGKVW